MEDAVTGLIAAFNVSNAPNARMFRRLRRTQSRPTREADRAREVLTQANTASERAEAAMAAGGDAGVMISSRTAVLETCEALEISLDALKATSDGHIKAIERDQHKMSVGSWGCARRAR